jgi:hypothetical protein
VSNANPIDAMRQIAHCTGVNFVARAAGADADVTAAFS